MPDAMETTCEPRLAYQDEESAIEFLTAAFGLREQARITGPDDSIMAWLAFGRHRLMVGRSGRDRHNLYSPRETGKPTAEINVSVDDIEAHFDRALSAGAAIGTPLQNAPFGVRHYRAVDPEGHGWHFMKPLQDIRKGTPTPEGLELRLFYADERAALDFLTRAFGFREQARIDDPGGGLMAWLGFGERMVMISRADAGQGQYSTRETAKPTAMINLQVDDVDEHYRHAVAQGVRMVTEIEDTAWGYRRYEALDPEGNRWHVMRPMLRVDNG